MHAKIMNAQEIDNARDAIKHGDQSIALNALSRASSETGTISSRSAVPTTFLPKLQFIFNILYELYR